MRITAGKYKNRRVECPPGEIRPAMDRMRESLFSILTSRYGGNLLGLSFCDAFSGSGLVAIEAASRGASPVHLVEMDRGKKATIMKNLSYVEERTQLHMMSVERYFQISPPASDIVYLDPPFPMENKAKLVELADKMKVVKPGGLLIIHYPREEKWPTQIGELTVIDERKYGRSVLLFFENGRK